MNSTRISLLQAPFHKELRILAVEANEDARLVLRQLGIHANQTFEKTHQAPLGEPITVRVGTHQFALRREVCRHILVEAV